MIYVGMIAYNEELYISAALKSIYSIADRIFVIDGSYQGPSTDCTAELASAVGPKVTVISGTFCDKSGNADHKAVQRNVYLSMMDKNPDNWCVIVDADEVFFDNQAVLLRKRLEQLSVETKAVTYGWIHLWGDFAHKITGGTWDMPREVNAFRLMDGVSHLSHFRVGFRRGNDELTYAKPPKRVFLDDVVFHHYGNVVTKEKKLWKLKFYLERGDYRGQGYNPGEWSRYEREVASPLWERRFEQPGVVPFTGEHPEAVRELVARSI
jgi:glycosyltransferase involved in cell wall biosynthesis